MRALEYLPSAKFAVMVGAIALSGALVVGAQYITRPPQDTSQLATNTTDAQAAQAASWQQALQDVEDQSGIKAPEAPNPDTVSSLLTAAQSSNLTTQVGRTLLINLSSANAQGLGQDTPTQDQLVAQATAQIHPGATTTIYTSADLNAVAQSDASLHAYGNALISIILAHPTANTNHTYAAVSYATDYQDPSKMADFPQVEAAYVALVKGLQNTAVPSTFVPLHLQLINDLSVMASLYPDIRQVLTDPLKGLAALKQYQSLDDEVSRVFTNIGQTIIKDGILFNKDEPGAAWSVLLSS